MSLLSGICHGVKQEFSIIFDFVLPGGLKSYPQGVDNSVDKIKKTKIALILMDIFSLYKEKSLWKKIVKVKIRFK